MAKNTSSRVGSATGSRTRRPNRSTAAERQITQAERKAAALIDAGRREADRIRRAAEADAKRTRADAEEHARRLVLDARASADGVRAEGMELVSNLREMGDVLRSNAERLLRDIQSIHSRMVGELGTVEPDGADEPDAPSSAPHDIAPTPERGAAAGSKRGDIPAPKRDAVPDDEEVLEVPDFVSPG